MHRNEWLPKATYRISVGLEPDTMQVMCARKVPHSYDVTVGATNKEATYPRNACYEGRGVFRWHIPCSFAKDHPGKCGEKLPDIFLPNGQVKPQIERLLQNRRKEHATATDHADRPHS